jgi:ABC-type proline/glycine betaine transport system ATPase subunit
MTKQANLSTEIKYEISITGRYPFREINVNIMEIAGVEINEETKVLDIVNAILERLSLDSDDFMEDMEYARETANSKY